MRNVMARVSQKEKKVFAEKPKQIWVQPERKDALRTAKLFMAEYRDRYPKAVAVLADGLEDSLQYYTFPDVDPRKVASTNVLERMLREVRRRSRVVGVFPSDDAYIRLMTCYLIEYTEDWVTERSYIRKEAIEATRTRLTNAA